MNKRSDLIFDLLKRTHQTSSSRSRRAEKEAINEQHAPPYRFTKPRLLSISNQIEVYLQLIEKSCLTDAFATDKYSKLRKKIKISEQEERAVKQLLETKSRFAEIYMRNPKNQVLVTLYSVYFENSLSISELEAFMRNLDASCTARKQALLDLKRDVGEEFECLRILQSFLHLKAQPKDLPQGKEEGQHAQILNSGEEAEIFGERFNDETYQVFRYFIRVILQPSSDPPQLKKVDFSRIETQLIQALQREHAQNIKSDFRAVEVHLRETAALIQEFLRQLTVHPLNQLNLDEQKNQELRDQYLAILRSTKRVRKLMLLCLQLNARIAGYLKLGSNAAYLLNMIHFPFNYKNLAYVQIQDVDLSRGEFLKTDLQKSRFKNVNISGCNFQDANLSFTNWQDVKVQLYDLIKIKDEELCFAYYSADGTKILFGLSFGSIQLWDISSKKVVHKMQHDEVIQFSAQSNDRIYVAYGGLEQTPNVYNLNTGKKVTFHGSHSSEILSATFAPDSSSLVTSSKDGTLRFWCLKTGQEVKRTVTCYKLVKALAFSPKGDLLVFETGKRSIGLLQVKGSNQKIKTLTGYSRVVNQIAFSPKGGFFASGGDDTMVRIWDTDLSELVCTLEQHRLPVQCVAYSPDGQLLASGSQESIIYVWHVEKRSIMNRFAVNYGTFSLSFCSKGEKLVSANLEMVCIWNVNITIKEERIEYHTDRISQISYSPDGTQVVTLSDDKTVRVWDAKTGILRVNLLILQIESLIQVFFTRDRDQLIVCRRDGVMLYCLNSGYPLAKTLLKQKKFTAFAMAGDFSEIAMGCQKGSILIYYVGQDKQVKVVNEPSVLSKVDPVDAQVHHMAYFPDDKTRLCVFYFDYIRIMNTDTNKILETIKLKINFKSPVVTPDAHYILAYDYDGDDEQEYVYVIDIAKKKIVRKINCAGESLNSITVLSGGFAIVPGAERKSFRIVRYLSGEEYFKFSGFYFPLFSTACKPDESELLTVCYDQTIRSWKIADLMPNLNQPLSPNTKYITKAKLHELIQQQIKKTSLNLLAQPSGSKVKETFDCRKQRVLIRNDMLITFGAILTGSKIQGMGNDLTAVLLNFN